MDIHIIYAYIYIVHAYEHSVYTAKRAPSTFMGTHHRRRRTRLNLERNAFDASGRCRTTTAADVKFTP